MADLESIAATLAAGMLSSANTAVSLHENGARAAFDVYRQVLASLREAHDAEHPSVDWRKEVLGRPVTVRSPHDRRAGWTGSGPVSDDESQPRLDLALK
jgi:hypothetical protein